jgi:anion-transporting  ArsA/GET3 family ATPase
MPERPSLEALAGRKLVVVTGKGGVGKSTVAAALGRTLRAAGRTVLVLEVDPRENVHQLLGLPPSGGEIVQVEAGLYLQNLKPLRVLDDIVREQVRVGALARRVLESPIYRQLAASMPGLKELAVLSHAMRLAERQGAERFDVVVLDAPASGHGVSLLAAPLLISEAIAAGPLGRAAARLAAFVADAERCAIVVVTLAEDMPVEEALALSATLAGQVGRAPELLVVNGLYPELPSAAGHRAHPTLELARARRRINDRELARLAASWTGPRLRLPLLPIDRGPELVAALGTRLLAGAAG